MSYWSSLQSRSVCATSGSLPGTHASTTGLQNLMGSRLGHEQPLPRGTKQSIYSFILHVLPKFPFLLGSRKMDKEERQVRLFTVHLQGSRHLTWSVLKCGSVAQPAKLPPWMGSTKETRHYIYAVCVVERDKKGTNPSFSFIFHNTTFLKATCQRKPRHDLSSILTYATSL